MSSTGNVIQNNTIFNNRGGISVYTNSVGTRVRNNTVYNNRPLEGIVVQGATDTVVINNNVYGNGNDILDLGQGDGFVTTLNPILQPRSHSTKTHG